MDYKDYYQILGVSRTASDKEIKKAYKKLARQHHPDLNDGDKNAESRFQDINEAYEVLGDQEKRAKYDRFGHQWKHAQAGGRPGGAGAGFDFDFSNFDFGGGGGGGGGGGFSSFFEQMFGGGGGQGRARSRSAKGKNANADVEVTLEEAFAGSTRTLGLSQTGTCGSCGGMGVTGQGSCPACRGRGQTVSEKRIEVKIPAGVTEGSKIRVRGKGDPGRGGGPPGDLYLNVKLKKHPRYEVKGQDLYLDVQVPFYRAALGGKIEVATLKGKVDLKIPPATQGGKLFRLSGLGLPGMGGKTDGNLYVRVVLTLPEAIDEEMDGLYRRFAELDQNS